jgi:hypothetical protein
MISIAAVCRRLGLWLVSLFLAAQIFAIVPLISGDIVHAAESELALAGAAGHVSAPQEHHHHRGDGCTQHHELRDLSGAFLSGVCRSEMAPVPSVVVALAPDALTENNPSRLERPPRLFLSI